MPHPAYPSAAALRCESDAVVRDLVDLVALRELRAIVADAIARAGQIDSLRHPDRRWSTEDLLDVLQEQLANVNDEADRIRRGPLVIEEAAG